MTNQRKWSVTEETQPQVEAFEKMPGELLELIARYGADFRAIITWFEENEGRVPTAEDLIWCESKALGRDVTKD